MDKELTVSPAPSRKDNTAERAPRELRRQPSSHVVGWRALCANKAAHNDEISVIRLGATDGTRCRLKDGTEILLLGSVPPATTHEDADKALQQLSAGDLVAAAKTLGHASPLTVAALVRAHLESSGIRVPTVLRAAQTSQLSQRDLARAKLHIGSPLPVPFVVTSSSDERLLGRRFGEEANEAAFPTPCVEECQVLSGSWVDVRSASAESGERAAECVIVLQTCAPYCAWIKPFPPHEDDHVYSKVHGLGPDGHHAVLVAVPKDAVPLQRLHSPDVREPDPWYPRLSKQQQRRYDANVLRCCIDRGRLFGGGAAAVRRVLEGQLAQGLCGVAFSTVLRAILNGVRVYAPTEHCLSFEALVGWTILCTSHPGWQVEEGLAEALISTAQFAQAADTRKSRMHWRQWRPSPLADAHVALCLELSDLERTDERGTSIRNSLRLLVNGFVPLQGDDVQMVARYADIFLRRGGMPLSALPVADPKREVTIGRDYEHAAVSAEVFPRLALFVQATLNTPPRCQSSDLKDNHLLNLNFFLEHAQYNIRDQKEAKLRGGFIENGDMERIVNMMDEKHFASGVDLAADRDAGDDSVLQESNVEGFVEESECHQGGERCRRLRDALSAVQLFLLSGPRTPAHVGPARYVPRPLTTMCKVRPLDGRARLEGFLSLFGATQNVVGEASTLRVTCCKLDQPDSPLVVQKGQAVDDHDPFKVITDAEEVDMATKGFCAAFSSRGASLLPLPPPGFRWRCAEVMTLRAEVAQDGLRFSVGEVLVPIFDAGSLLVPCEPPGFVYDLKEDEQLLRRALYLDPCEQVSLLWHLRERARELRSSPFQEAAPCVPEWVEVAMKSPVAVVIWQELYARLLLEESREGNATFSIAAPHPYQGLMLRLALVLQLLYFDVLLPSNDDLVFLVRRRSRDTATRHFHLTESLKMLSFSGQPTSCTSEALCTKVKTPRYDYQMEAVQRLVESRNRGFHGSLDASSLGAGKTLVALSFCVALAHAHGGGRFLVLVGSESLMEGWQDQVLEHVESVELLVQQENGMLRSRGAAQRPGVATIVLSTYSRAMRHPFSCTFLLVVADECLALQNQSLQTAAAWRLVTRSLYGGHFISGTMFRRHYRDLLDMLQLLRSCLPLQPEFIHAYFEEHLIMYSRESRPWETRLEPMEIPDSVRNQYLEVLDECRGRDAQNYTQVLGRMRQVLNQALRDGRLLAERIWAAVSGLRAEGFKPIIFAATETEAEAIVRHIGCAHRYRHERHPKNCPGCDRCRNFNKFDVGGHSIVVSGSDGPQMDPLVVFTVGADAQGLNLQHLGDAIVLRPTQMDLLVQIMGRLDRPGQASERLCRTIIYLRRSHEEAEVAHLSKYAAFWSLHIRPLARDIVNATMESCNQEEGAVAERLLSLVEGKSSEREASSSVRSGGANTSPREPKIKPRSFLDAECWALQRKDQGGETPVWARRFVGGATGLQAVCRTVKRKVSDQSDVCADTSRPPVRMTEKSLQDGLKFLLDHDAQFRHILQLVGPPTDILELLNKEIPDAFTSLAQTICFQQLSLKVCQQMFDRLLGLCGDRERKLLSPERVLATEARQLREVAKLSFRKVLYIQEAAEQFASGKLSTAWFEQATDHEARQRLNSLNGIGEWSTEMFLIFQLHRHGGYLYGDVAFQKAIRMVYDVQAPPEVTKLCDVSWRPSREQMEERTRLWGPFSSIGCLYCLRVADNEKSAIFLPETSTSIGVPFALPVELDPAKDTVKGKRPKRLKSEKSDESALRVSLAETEGNGPKRPKFSVELKPCASVFSIVLKNTGEVTDLG